MIIINPAREDSTHCVCRCTVPDVRTRAALTRPFESAGGGRVTGTFHSL
jgi:hypothetical protein